MKLVLQNTDRILIIFNHSDKFALNIYQLQQADLLYQIPAKMGNSKSSPGIAIYLSKPFYLSGQAIQGSVLINSPKPYPSSRIILKITGFESTEWRNQINKKSHQSTENKIIVENKKKQQRGPTSTGCLKIIQTSYVLHSWSGNYNIHGQYQFPFVFYLPSFLPASFRQKTEQYTAKIVYEIECTSISPRSELPDLVHSQQVIIRIPKKNKDQALDGQLILRPKTCCCYSGGFTKIVCFFQKNQYLSNQQCVAYCTIDNYNSSKQIKQIKAKLKRVIVLNSSFGDEITFTQTINQVRLPGVKAQKGQNQKRLVFPLKYRKSNQSLPPTTKGSIIKSYYFLQLYPILSGYCVKNNSYLTVGLEIVQQGIEQRIEKPADWNPKIFNASTIVNETSLYTNKRLNNMNSYN